MRASRSLWGAHAPRVPFAAPRREPRTRGRSWNAGSNFASFGEAPNGAREARALPNPPPAPPLSCLKTLRPFLHLLGEGTLRAVGLVLQAKVFVDLEQPLLSGHRAQKAQSARVVAEETRSARFDTSIR